MKKKKKPKQRASKRLKETGSTLFVKYRNPKTGRFQKPNGRTLLQQEIFDALSGTRIARGSSKRWKTPPKKKRKPKRAAWIHLATLHLQGVTVKQALTRARAMTKVSRYKQIEMRLSFEHPDSRGVPMKFRKRIKLATKGKDRRKKNRSQVIGSLLDTFNRLGVKASPKKFRTGAAKRQPTARNVTVEIWGLKVPQNR